MVVRFNSKKVRENTTIDIGVEHDPNHAKGVISEAEMIVEQARRNSAIPPEGAPLSEAEKEDLTNTVIKEHVQEEAGPEMTPEGHIQAEKAMQIREGHGGGSADNSYSHGKALV